MTRTDRRPRQRLGEAARREAILTAAGRAFADRPYDQVAVARVAEEAGASEALVHRYFGSKSGLYLATVRGSVKLLLDRQRAADAALPADATPRDRLAESVRVYLDSVTTWAVGWLAPLQSPGGEPPTAAELRTETRAYYVRLMRTMLGTEDGSCDYALHGYLGFLDAACLAWAARGYPDADRALITGQALNALDGALRAAGHRGL
ncbi:TetR/AcrR family transcriptional regulator [Catenuloplanes atrovinosus]|uniref:AcrR family transcriptional regulator n=1 Tax=Catenuloplanes atrovinosus TaxID=137266 RepID=A0AAE4C9D9_9ACTN|nr:helix-turn-helix domain-containing protein [Catenuloplanes atrovinosus]MDR7273480.1 AcrR family transcriptional regulator [Catenuloplanes atrovinosus]